MTPAERLVARIRSTGILAPAGIVLPEGVTAVRLRPGPWQRSAGAWAWRLQGPGGEPAIRAQGGRLVAVGSTTRMGELLAADGWEVDQHLDDLRIDPA